MTSVLGLELAAAPAGVSVDSTERFYDSNAREYFRRTISVDLSPLYDRVLRHVRASGRILDAGCGSGRDLQVFRRRGLRGIGIDASHALIRLARESSGVACLPMRLEDVTFAGRFDAVWACASLLHISKHGILEVVGRLHRALSAGGVMFASVQVGTGEGVGPDGRFFAYYTPQEFHRVLEESGFAIDEAWIGRDLLAQRRAVRWANVIVHR